MPESSTGALWESVPSNFSAQVIALIHQMTQKQGFGEQELYNANHSVAISTKLPKTYCAKIRQESENLE